MVFRDDIASTPIGVLKDHGRMVNFFEATNFNEMAPHDELALEATQYILADPGNSYILFGRTPSRQGLGVKDLVEGIYDLRWFDPVTGAWLVQHNVPLAAGDQAFALPPGIGTEVALHIRLLALLPLGDVNLDGELNGLDVEPFVDVLLGGLYQHGADMNGDGHVNGLDVDPFVATDLGRGGAGTATGTVVPEPSASALVAAAFCFIVLRKGRSGSTEQAVPHPGGGKPR